jgi:hypothetical protein
MKTFFYSRSAAINSVARTNDHEFTRRTGCRINRSGLENTITNIYPAKMYHEIPISYLSITIAFMVFKMIVETKKK